MDIEYNQVRLSSPPLLGRGARQWISSKTRSDSHEFLKLPVIAFLNLWSPTPTPMPMPTPIPPPTFNSLMFNSFFFFFFSFNHATKFNSCAPASVNLARPTKPTVTAPMTAPATAPATVPATAPAIALPASLTNQSYHLQPCPIYQFASPTRRGRFVNCALVDPD